MSSGLTPRMLTTITPRRAPRPLEVCPLPMHPLRADLQDELHARPFPILSAPWAASHLVMLIGEQGRAQEREHLANLCARYGVEPPSESASFFIRSFEGFELRWERHTEFSALTISRRPMQPTEDPFERMPVTMLPTDWLSGVSGQVVTATHVVLLPRDRAEPTMDQLHGWFEGHRLIASRPVEGSASLWTACRIHSDGFGRVLIRDETLTDCRAGRLFQRVLELETYRAMAMLALPVARNLGAELTRLDDQLAAVIDQMSRSTDVRDDRVMLGTLTELAAKVERMRGMAAYRFNAALAYHALVEARLRELREHQVVGLRTMGEFLDRRMTPAMRTVASVRDRLEHLSVRLDRACDLLRTRIDLELREQNQAVLASMDRRARLQLRLQQTVEGLSVAAVSYYLLGLIHYGLEGLHARGVHVDPVVGTAVALPLVLMGVWLAIRRVHRAVRHQEA